MLLSAAGCAIPNNLTSTEKVFSVEAYDLQITADSTFYEKTGGSFDLQITNDNAFVSVMAYGYADLPEGVTPLDVFEIQNEELFSKREAVTVIEEAKTQTLPQNVITKALYSAEKDGVKNYYMTYLVDLPSAKTLAWVLVTAVPSYLDKNREYLHGIVCSLTTVK